MERMARTKEMAFEKNNRRSNMWHWTEETSTTTYWNQYRNRSEECHCWYRNWDWHSSKTATNRWYTSSRSFGEMRRSEDDPTNLYTFWIGFSKHRNNIIISQREKCTVQKNIRIYSFIYTCVNVLFMFQLYIFNQYK